MLELMPSLTDSNRAAEAELIAYDPIRGHQASFITHEHRHDTRQDYDYAPTY